MYGLNASVKTDFLVGRKLTQVRIGEFQVQLCFDEDVIIAAEGAVSIDGQRYEDPRRMSAPLASLLGGVTIRADNPGTGDLVVKMVGGRDVIVHDSKPAYESYTVTWKGGTLVV